MFSGIIRHKGKVLELKKSADHTELAVESDLASCASLGDSIAVSGVCLTVKKIKGSALHFDLASETLRCSKLSSLLLGEFLNLEPSLLLGEKIHGHLVYGHIDAVGSLLKQTKEESTLKFEFSLPNDLRGLVAPKGSVCIDGVSLTVGEVSRESFSVYLIPYTLDETTLGELKVGDLVNLEADCLARYAREILKYAK